MSSISSGSSGFAEFARASVLAHNCPSRDVLNHVVSRWGVLVLLALRDGQCHRFSELRRKIGGVSEKMLAQTLQLLEGDGFVLRTVYPVVPPHVEYQLTEPGGEVAQHVAGLASWIESNLPQIFAARESYRKGKAGTGRTP